MVDGLAEAARLAALEPGRTGYADYCRLRAAGLRARALGALDIFLAEAAVWPLAERIAFAKWVAGAADHDPLSALLPDPMVRGLLVPALAEASGDPEALALLGLFGDPHGEPLARYLAALEQAPADPVAAKLFIRAVLRWVGYAQHELPHGYLGDPAEDIALLERAASLLPAGAEQHEPIDHHLAAARRMKRS